MFDYVARTKNLFPSPSDDATTKNKQAFQNIFYDAYFHTLYDKQRAV